MPQPNERKRVPWYFISIVGFFIVPIIGLFAGWVKVDRKPLLKAVAVIMVLGYAWSMLVSSQGWWVFNPQTMLGVYVLPYLPLEEVLFYPLGGMLSIMVYAACRPQTATDSDAACRPLFWGMLGATLFAAALVLVSAWQQKRIPAYLVSQLIFYNGLCLGAWHWTRQWIMPRAALATVAIMTVIGFFWNWIAFTHGWWEYHATLGWQWPAHVPVDDWNFYLFAPLAAISLFECFQDRSTP